MSSRKIDIVIGAIALALFCLTNLPWQLDDYDQAKQAFTSFEMVKEGHWLYQRTPHERVATKPPLVGWISAATYEVTRSWNLAWRLPSLGAAIALSILLYRAGGLIAFAAFAFNLLTPRLASLVRTDMPLALVIFAIGLTIWNHIRERREWNVRDQLSIFALLTAAMLIKGPIVYAFLVPGISVAAVYGRRPFARTPQTAVVDRRDRRMLWPGLWPWLASLGIFLAWVLVGCAFVPNFYEQVVLREFLGRFGETVHRQQPIWFYLPHLLHKFAPWSLFLLAVAIVDLRDRLTSDAATRKIAPETLWLICWSLGGLLVMSLIPSKRVDRMFPVIPPMCLLLATQLGGAGGLRRHRRWIFAMIALSILYASGYSGWRVHTAHREQRDALVKFGANVRAQAGANHWRYEVVNASDEGLLLYCDKLRFVRRDDALERWRRGEVDALVVPADQAALFADGAAQMSDARGRYVLLAREK